MFLNTHIMKKTINLCLAAICWLSLASCSKYYIGTISSSNISKNEKTGAFEIENDSVKIVYSFAGADAPVRITVRNKLTIPIYIDWAKSSLIYKENAISFVPEMMAFTGALSTSSLGSGGVRFTDGDFSGKMELPKQISFIPPNASVETTTLFTTGPVSKNLPDSIFKNKEMLTVDKGPILVKTGIFTKENSPVVFRSYLTLFSKDDEVVKTFSYDSEFYISKSVRTYSSPKYIREYQNNKSDVFYTSSKTFYGKAFKGVAVVGLVTGAAAVMQIRSEEDK